MGFGGGAVMLTDTLDPIIRNMYVDIRRLGANNQR